MLEMTSSGNTTILMTTHYIEEARQAHLVSSTYGLYFGVNLDLIQVGLMRQGKMLTQDKPEDLIYRYNATVSYVLTCNIHNNTKRVS